MSQNELFSEPVEPAEPTEPTTSERIEPTTLEPTIAAAPPEPIDPVLDWLATRNELEETLIDVIDELCTLPFPNLPRAGKPLAKLLHYHESGLEKRIRQIEVAISRWRGASECVTQQIHQWGYNVLGSRVSNPNLLVSSQLPENALLFTDVAGEKYVLFPLEKLTSDFQAKFNPERCPKYLFQGWPQSHIVIGKAIRRVVKGVVPEENKTTWHSPEWVVTSEVQALTEAWYLRQQESQSNSEAIRRKADKKMIDFVQAIE